MTLADNVQHSFPQEIEEIRGLQLRIYREIGILAVAAELNVSTEQCELLGEADVDDKNSVQGKDGMAA